MGSITWKRWDPRIVSAANKRFACPGALTSLSTKDGASCGAITRLGTMIVIVLLNHNCSSVSLKERKHLVYLKNAHQEIN